MKVSFTVEELRQTATATKWRRFISVTFNSSVPQPKLALCGFARVHLERGESTKVAMEVPAERLRYWDTEKKQYVVEPGKYEFLIGALPTTSG